MDPIGSQLRHPHGSCRSRKEKTRLQPAPGSDYSSLYNGSRGNSQHGFRSPPNHTRAKYPLGRAPKADSYGRPRPRSKKNANAILVGRGLVGFLQSPLIQLGGCFDKYKDGATAIQRKRGLGGLIPPPPSPSPTEISAASALNAAVISLTVRLDGFGSNQPFEIRKENDVIGFYNNPHIAFPARTPAAFSISAADPFS